jgi:hypothetical protein
LQTLLVKTVVWDLTVLFLHFLTRLTLKLLAHLLLKLQTLPQSLRRLLLLALLKAQTLLLLLQSKLVLSLLKLFKQDASTLCSLALPSHLISS